MESTLGKSRSNDPQSPGLNGHRLDRVLVACIVEYVYILINVSLSDRTKCLMLGFESKCKELHLCKSISLHEVWDNGCGITLTV